MVKLLYRGNMHHFELFDATKERNHKNFNISQIEITRNKLRLEIIRFGKKRRDLEFYLS